MGTPFLIESVSLFATSFGYLGIAAVTVVAAPELVLPFLGFLISRGDLSFVGVLAASAAGAMLGQGTIYSVARGVGEARIRTFFRRYGRVLLVSEHDLERSLALFERFEHGLLVFGRAVPTVRSLISVPAGLQRVPFATFAALTALGTLLWNTLLLWAGTAVSHHWQRLAAGLEAYGNVVIALLLAAALFLGVRRFREKRADRAQLQKNP